MVQQTLSRILALSRWLGPVLSVLTEEPQSGQLSGSDPLPGASPTSALGPHHTHHFQGPAHPSGAAVGIRETAFR